MPITKASGNSVTAAAKGDLVVGTTTNDSGILGVGSTDQVLTVDSSTATGLKWAAPAAGGMTLISTTTLSGATTTLSSIPQTYNSLVIIVSGMTANTSNKVFRGLPLGNADNSTYVFIEGANNTTLQRSGSYLALYGLNGTDRTNSTNSCFIQIDNYASTTAIKPVIFYSRYQSDGSGQKAPFGAGAIQDNAAITSFAFDYEGVNTFAGGTVLLYGVK
jgi:hypothetical protein